jgi:ribose transport system permease protein
MTTTTTTTTATAEVPVQKRTSVGKFLVQGGTTIALLLLIVFFFAMRPDVFLTFTNVRNILFQISILAIISGAQTLVMVVGDFDLSLAATSSLAGAVAASMMLDGTSTWTAVLVALAVGLLIGIGNGLLVAYVNLSAFVATLATMTSVTGLAYLVTEVYIAIGLGVLLWALLRFTTTGRKWYAIGGNVEVSRLSGINVQRGRLLAFTAAGLISAIAGVLLAARLGSASAVQGSDNLLFSVAAVFLGMTVIKSGRANLVGTMVGVAIIGVMSNGLNILGVNSYVQQVVTGLIIIAAVTLSSVRMRER